MQPRGRVLSRIYCLEKKCRVAKGHDVPGGVWGYAPPEIFSNEYGLRYNMTTILRNDTLVFYFKILRIIIFKLHCLKIIPNLLKWKKMFTNC